MARLRALALGDDEHAPGYLGERAEQLGIELTAVGRTAEGTPPGLAGYDLLLPLGSSWSVTEADRLPWVRRELDLVRTAVDRDVPVLGVCFGGQELAAVLGGRVSRGARAEIGWTSIRTSEPDAVPAGPWFQWHYDVIDPPDGAVTVADNAVCVQAFRYGRHLALQFHPEVTRAIIASWITEGRADLDRDGISESALLADSDARLPAARPQAHRLLDAFLAAALD
jgi:GMP synthase-like glutamine amidotransferase